MPFGNVNVDYAPCKSVGQLRSAALYMLGQQKQQIQSGIIKTEGSLYTALGCDRDNFANSIMVTRKLNGKSYSRLRKNEILAHKISISFHPDDNDKLDYEIAFKIAREFAEKFFYSKGYEVLLAVHTDREHMYCLRKTTRSFKDKRQIAKPQDEWVVIENTHEALVSHEDFETVQKRISIKHSYTQENPDNIFRGLIFCGECGRRLSFQKTSNNKSKGAYRCERNIRLGKDECSSHHIRFEQLEQVVLHDIQRHVKFASDNVNEYAKHLLELANQGSAGDISSRKRSVSKAQKRLNELDKLLQKLYEDKVFGIISDERYATMSKSMEDEAAGLKRKIAEDTAYINNNAEKSKGVDDFVKLISGYESVTALDSELLHTLIDKIVVHEYENTDSGKSMQIEIYYRFIGNIGGESLAVAVRGRKAA